LNSEYLLRQRQFRVRVIIEPWFFYERRLFVSSGTSSASDEKIYEDNARVPNPLWSECSRTTFRDMVDVSDEWGHGRSLCFGMIQPQLLVRLRDALKYSSSTDAARWRGKEGADTGAVENAVEMLSEIVEFSGDIIFHGISIDAANQLTVSRDEITYKKIGLHMDNWDRMEVSNRDDALNRISVNIGCGDRAFMFIPFRGSRMRQLIEDAGYCFDSDGQRGRQLMTLWPTLPVIKVVLGPGCYYIVPTDNVIHDGSTEGLPGGASVLIRGRIQPRPASD
jgi:hypothetical protein